jgi:hypothetical protein
MLSPSAKVSQNHLSYPLTQVFYGQEFVVKSQVFACYWTSQAAVPVGVKIGDHRGLTLRRVVENSETHLSLAGC